MLDPAWKMLQEAGKRIVDRAIDEFAMKVKAGDTTRIIELQTIIRKYKYGLFDEVRMLKMESDQAYAEAKERGVLNSWWESFKSNL